MLIGNLGNLPEQRFTPGGVAVTSFSLAVNRQWTDGEGNKQSKSTWFRITCWRKQAEIAAQYLVKGSKVMIIGEVEEARPYTDRDGNQRASIEVTAQVLKFLDGSRNGERVESDGSAQREDNTVPF